MCFLFLVLSVDRGSWEQTLGDFGGADEVVRVCWGLVLRFRLMGHVSPGHIAPPDGSDSDGYCGPGIWNFLLFPIPLATPPSPCDKRKRCHVR